MATLSEKKRRREAKWNEMFDRLEALVREAGADLYADLSGRDAELARWAEAQRSAKESAALPKAKIDRLEALGFSWESARPEDPDAVLPLKSLEEIENTPLPEEGTRARRRGRPPRPVSEAPSADVPPAEDLLARIWEKYLDAIAEARQKLPGQLQALDSWMYEGWPFSRWLGKQRRYWAVGMLPRQHATRLRELRVEPSAEPSEERRRRLWETRAQGLLHLHRESKLRGDAFFESLPRKPFRHWFRQQRERAFEGSIRDDERRFLDGLGFPWQEQHRAYGKTGSIQRLAPGERPAWWPEFTARLQTAWAALPALIRDNLASWRYGEVKDPDFQSGLDAVRTAMKAGAFEEEMLKLLRDHKVSAKVSRHRFLYEEAALRFARIRDLMSADPLAGDFVERIPDRVIQKWARRQALRFQAGELPEDETRLLRASGLPLTPKARVRKKRPSAWPGYLEELRSVIEKYNSFFYPPDHPRFDALERWKFKQRIRRRNGKLEPGRVEQLDSLGFPWGPWAETDESWNTSFAKLVAFKKQHGHINVPEEWKDDPAFGKWVAAQREAMGRAPKAQDRTRRLRGLGLRPPKGPAKVVTRRWMNAYNKVRNHLRDDLKIDRLVPGQRLEPRFERFLAEQRRARESEQLSEKQIQLLDEMGMEWSAHWTPPAARRDRGPGPEWLAHYDELKALTQKHGPSIYLDRRLPGHLKQFATTQRMRRARGKLGGEQLRLLEAIQFDWNPREKIRPAWMRRFEALKRFKEKHGTADVPRKYPPDQGLAEFVSQERQRARKGLLKPAHLRLLKEVGFRFETIPPGTRRHRTDSIKLSD